MNFTPNVTGFLLYADAPRHRISLSKAGSGRGQNDTGEVRSRPIAVWRLQLLLPPHLSSGVTTGSSGSLSVKKIQISLLVTRKALSAIYFLDPRKGPERSVDIAKFVHGFAFLH